MTQKSFKFILIFLFILTARLYCQVEGDRILAIVGNDIITLSDLKEQIGNYLKQNHIAPSQYNEYIGQQVFQAIYTEKLLLAKGQQDSVTVEEEDVQRELDKEIKNIMDNYGSEAALERYYGQTLAKLKESLHDDIKKQMIVEKVRMKKFGSQPRVSPAELDAFLKLYSDSTILKVPETYELYQIVVFPKPTEEAKQIAYQKAKAIRDTINAGAAFEDMVRRNSEDSLSRASDGYLGTWEKGSFFKQFEDAAFLLKPGGISEVVETPLGYHIIRLVSKNVNQIETAHILVKFPRTPDSDKAAYNKLIELKETALKGDKTFQQLALLNSEDMYSAQDSGFIGKIGLNNLDSGRINAIKKLDIGEITDPIPLRIGAAEYNAYAIYLLKNKFPERKLTKEADYKIVENYALNFKMNKEMADWIAELEKSIYVDKRLY